MTSLGPGPISFSDLKTYYVADGDNDASGDSNLQGKSAKTSIQLSWFSSATLQSSNPPDGEDPTNSDVPASNISFNSVFVNKTFGAFVGGSGGHE